MNIEYFRLSREELQIHEGDYNTWGEFKQAIANTATLECLKKLIQWGDELCTEHVRVPPVDVYKGDCYECTLELKNMIGGE